jgi:hypothetical protein
LPNFTPVEDREVFARYRVSLRIVLSFQLADIDSQWPFADWKERMALMAGSQYQPANVFVRVVNVPRQRRLDFDECEVVSEFGTQPSDDSTRSRFVRFA